jgi:hypothetical protein
LKRPLIARVDERMMAESKGDSMGERIFMNVATMEIARRHT